MNLISRVEGLFTGTGALISGHTTEETVPSSSYHYLPIAPGGGVEAYAHEPLPTSNS